MAAIITRGRGRVDAELIGKLRGLRVVARAGVGLDNVDLGTAKSRGVCVLNVPDALTTTVAEHALALALAGRGGCLGRRSKISLAPALRTRPAMAASAATAAPKLAFLNGGSETNVWMSQPEPFQVWNHTRPLFAEGTSENGAPTTTVSPEIPTEKPKPPGGFAFLRVVDLAADEHFINPMGHIRDTRISKHGPSIPVADFLPKSS